MTHTPDTLSLSTQSFDHFLTLLPRERVTRCPDCVTIHADCGDVLWFLRGGRWITAAPGFDRARRGMARPERLN